MKSKICISSGFNFILSKNLSPSSISLSPSSIKFEKEINSSVVFSELKFIKVMLWFILDFSCNREEICFSSAKIQEASETFKKFITSELCNSLSIGTTTPIILAAI